MIKSVVDGGKTNKVLGAHMVGEHALEIIQIAVAINKGVTRQNY